ncbi:MAG: O-methyltransferase [Candidatus Eremiobacteraeota bacterium]|nr:O-methyltransferase [Candidatus Eremiobacteraeota bacterium]
MLHEDIFSYLETTHDELDPLLLELEQHGRKEEVPAVSRSLGRLLSVLVHAMQANRVLEIGTAYGYATLWMALSLPPAGKIWTFDPNIERTDVARSYFERAGVADRIELINQPAQEILPIFPQRNLDIVFIDAQKTEYDDYLERVVPMLKLSGLVIVHNLLLSGRVLAKPSRDDDEELTAIRHFNRRFLNHPDLDATIIPIADGTGIGSRTQ